MPLLHHLMGFCILFILSTASLMTTEVHSADLLASAPYRYRFLWEGPVVMADIAPDQGLLAEPAALHDRTLDPSVRQDIDPGTESRYLRRISFPIAVRRASPRAPWSGSPWAVQGMETLPEGLTIGHDDQDMVLVECRLEQAQDANAAPILHQTIAVHPHLARAWQVELVNLHGVMVKGPLVLTVTIRQLPIGFDAGIGMASLHPVTPADTTPVSTDLAALHFAAVWAEIQLPERPLIAYDLDPAEPPHATEDRWHHSLNPLPRPTNLPLRPRPPPETPAPEDAPPRQPFLTRSFDAQQGWRLHHPDDAVPRYADGPQHHALALLTFGFNDFDHRRMSRHRTLIGTILERLLAQEQDAGRYADQPITQALVVMALDTLFASSGDGALMAPLIRARDHLLDMAIRDAEGVLLGWSQDDPGWIDSEATALCLTALRLLHRNRIPSNEALATPPWVSTAHDLARRQGRSFPARFHPQRSAIAGPDQPHAALLMMAPTNRPDAMTKALVDDCIDTLLGTRNPLTVLLATVAILNDASRDHWSLWRVRINDLLFTQHIDGPLYGSWDPVNEADDRIVTTAYTAMTLGYLRGGAMFHDPLPRP